MTDGPMFLTPPHIAEDAALALLLAQDPGEAASVRFATASEQLLAMIDAGDFIVCSGGTLFMLHGFVQWLKLEADRAERAEMAAQVKPRPQRWFRWGRL